MLKPIIGFLLFLPIFLLSITRASAQSQDKKTDQAYMADIANMLSNSEYIIDPPDTGFVSFRDGKGERLTNEKLQIHISIFTVPASYTKMLDDSRKSINKDGQTFKDSAHIKAVSGKRGFMTIQDAVITDSKLYETQIVMTFLYDLKGYCVIVSSVYPKALDKEWRQKLISSSLTIREEKN